MGNMECQELLKIWGDLESQGIPLEPMEYRTSTKCSRVHRGLVIEQIGDLSGNIIFELDNHQTGYVLNPSILCDLPGETFVMDCWIEAPWEEEFFELLSDPAENGSRSVAYSFSKTWEYPRSEVINHRLKGALRRGSVREGLLLGVGWARLPETYREGAQIPITLNILDQWGRIHFSLFTMWLVNRVPLQKPIRRKNAREGLFSKRDRIYPLCEPSEYRDRRVKEKQSY